ncbi:hypothetical protein HRI_001512800 [Hibiscus trionum]|uniref:Retroviral polymerase SH3-like domain-containing protein n=1 Tax=Hibiscus trionum TaxID=183268 RepID=A0A9W7HIM1_HIBTR|nr:hypothetical protein HRI_001512800 [Hibiscus trionum]
MTRSMLKSKQMPNEFWKAISCAVYLVNRCFTKSLMNKTPQEACSGRKPSVSHLRVFESLAYAQILELERTKLDDRSRRYVFIGYGSNSKGYKLFQLDTRNVVINRDVEFDEQNTWDGNTSKKTCITSFYTLTLEMMRWKVIHHHHHQHKI